jgi:glyoxylase-like metal-dependent hydrolase (beta-lactamase superfamily II)
VLVDAFGTIIHKARVGRDLTLEEVARRADMPMQRLERLEACEQRPGEAEAARLASVLALAPGPLWRIAEGSWHPQPVPQDMNGLIVHTMAVRLPDGRVSNCHLAGYEGDEEAIVVDPGGEPDCILAELDRRGWCPRYVALTHGHAAHVGALRPIVDEWGVSVLVSAAEIPLIGWSDGRFHEVKPGETLTLGRYWVKSLFTPGHTAGGISFLLDHACFVGDALFAGTIGEATIPDGHRQLLDALKREVMALPPDTRLFPGHGPNTMVGEEREHNPFFAG